MKTLKFVIPVFLLFVIISFAIQGNNYLNATNSPLNTIVKVSVRSPIDSSLISGAVVVVTGPGGNKCCGVTDQNGMFGCEMPNGNITVCASYSNKYQTKTIYCWDYSCFFDMIPNNNGTCNCDNPDRPIKP